MVEFELPSMAEFELPTRGRIERAREWLLLDGNREVIAGGVLAFVFVTVLAWPYPFPDPEASEMPITRLFAAFIGGNLTLITVVISINQLVLSRELRTPRELTEEIDASVRYRDDVTLPTGPRAGPESPSVFLEHVLTRLARAIGSLEGTAADVDDDDLARDLATVVARLDAKTQDMRRLLEQRDVGLFTALSTILRRSLASEYNRCRWLVHAHGPDLGDDTVATLSALQRRIVHVEIARHYVKTMYVQVELAKLSRRLLYVGFVALAVAALAIVSVGSPRPAPSVLYVAAIVASFAPFAFLLAYILRVATVAQRTAAFVPFGGTN